LRTIGGEKIKLNIEVVLTGQAMDDIMKCDKIGKIDQREGGMSFVLDWIRVYECPFCYQRGRFKLTGEMFKRRGFFKSKISSAEMVCGQGHKFIIRYHWWRWWLLDKEVLKVLVLTLKAKGRVFVGEGDDAVVVTVNEVEKNQVSLGVTTPGGLPIIENKMITIGQEVNVDVANKVSVKVTLIRGCQVELGFTAPSEVPILREGAKVKEKK
jgi:sRNA-binding carbon storage regulator CsrA